MDIPFCYRGIKPALHLPISLVITRTSIQVLESSIRNVPCIHADLAYGLGGDLGTKAFPFLLMGINPEG